MTWLRRWWWRGVAADVDAAAAREQEAKLREAQRETLWLEEHGRPLVARLGAEAFADRVRTAMSLSTKPRESR
jgi:hypothetical protein